MFGQGFEGAVVEQHPLKRPQQTLRAHLLAQITEQSDGHLKQESLEGGVEPFLQSLFGIGQAGHQSNDTRNWFQGKGGFGGQGDQSEQEILDGDFAGFALQETGLTSHGLAIQLGQGGTNLLEVPRESLRDGRGEGG
jgi:hypothetical protein